jgi:hypothetical protein
MSLRITSSPHTRRIMHAMEARTESDIHLDVPVELAEDRNHPVEREPAKLGIANAREFGVRNARQFLGVACRKLTIVDDVDDLPRDNCASLLKPCVWASKVAVDVAASGSASSLFIKRTVTNLSPCCKPFVKTMRNCHPLWRRRCGAELRALPVSFDAGRKTSLVMTLQRRSSNRRPHRHCCPRQTPQHPRRRQYRLCPVPPAPRRIRHFG